MEDSAAPKVENNVDQMSGYFIKIENTAFVTPTRQNTIIKYTKLPEYELHSKVSWPQNSYTLQPRLRRIIGLDENDIPTSRSLYYNLTIPSKIVATGLAKRKIVTISEDEESDLHPHFYTGITRKSNVIKTSNRSTEANLKEDNYDIGKTSSRLASIQKQSKNHKSCAKMNNLFVNKDIGRKTCVKTKTSNLACADQNEHRNMNGKEFNHNLKYNFIRPKTTVASNSKNIKKARETEKDINIIKYKLNDQNMKTNAFTKKLSEKPHINKLTSSSNKNKELTLKDNNTTNKSVIVIHVPVDGNHHNPNIKETVLKEIDSTDDKIKIGKIDHGTNIDKVENIKNVCIETDSPPKTTDQMIEVNQYDLMKICKCIQNADVQTEVLQNTFDSLDIPNVTLIKDKSELKDELLLLESNSLPNLQMPTLKISPDKGNIQTVKPDNLCKNTSSYIIRRATVTYTTKKEINFQVVNSSTVSNPCPSPLTYPLSVMSMFKREAEQYSDTSEKYGDKFKTEFKNKNDLDDLKSFNCSYSLNSNKLIKPSDIISTIRVNNVLLQNDSVCEQFQKELHFIDSFFESLQYLENSSISQKCFQRTKIDNFSNNSTLLDTDFEDKNSEYGSLLSKLGNGLDIDDTETIASKSLSLLNLLIRDEQRRAKNLLFVLKMREDALKDFTKSQILWLENKKRRDNNNTTISTLKKKQRGALLKLQHECGEMQRMRKALLTLSEKRKVALMKTKKNIELKLKNDVNFEQIILGKKQLKRSTDHTPERNVTPLKCFDLSSSGCEEYNTSKHNSDICKQTTEVCSPLFDKQVKSAEKCIQTGDVSTIGSQLGESIDTTAENFVAVDGGYLNILFHNLSLPQIFSSGKQYEVNEEALKNIVTTTNSSCSDFNDTELVDKLMDHIKSNRNLDRSSSPSTARSLVDEFDQYYKLYADEDKTSILANLDYKNQSSVVFELKDALLQSTDSRQEKNKTDEQIPETQVHKRSTEALYDGDNLFQCDFSLNTNDNDIELDRFLLPTGPLPVPVGEAAVTESKPLDVPAWSSAKSLSTSNSTDSCSFSSQPLCGSAPSLLSLSSTVHSEAEELRRQQLAIEREIKALEQQQCRLLVVREIPDKPPPPYTPPSDPRVSKLPRMFNPDESTNEKIHRVITDPNNANIDPTDSFDIFLQDFCQESVERQKLERSDKPWDACNLLPLKPLPDTNQLVKKTSSQLLEVLTAVAPAVVSSVGTRRSDHIDDILFSEWRRCESEWTNLHNDEAVVKNQVFESIFQKILTETIDEYKRIVHNSAVDKSQN